ncbi:unnamed protein product [Medioppia subpectinata]|uniref:FAS1 domain-containing protein n=1 Tax=Medioppia subpectinata TaxID=1979941 RepID=A0A7R9L1B2_9ACAR|nr:unnamed protein product [Medioppia subpectinata]CAG2113376.1 unnamed protein product [Medioppia subpectinata]
MDFFSNLNFLYFNPKLTKKSNLYIEWEGKRARIVRPDVQAINGVIHVIDTVLMKKRDLSVNSSSHPVVSITLTIIIQDDNHYDKYLSSQLNNENNLKQIIENN